MNEIKRISMAYKNIIILMNSIKYQEDIKDIANCSNESEVMNLPFMLGSRLFSNMNNISDENMGKFSPIVKIQGYPLFANRYNDNKYNFGKDRTDSCWSKRGSRLEDNGRTDTALFRQNNREYVYIDDGMECKPRSQLSDFDRIAVLIEQWNNNYRNVIIYSNDYDEYFITTETQNTGIFKARYIKNGIKSSWYDMFCYRSSDNLTIDYRDIGRMDISLLTGGINSSGSPSIVATGYEWAMNNILNGAIPYLCSYSGGTLYNVDTDFMSNCWLFSSESDLNNYLDTGDYSTALNYNGTPKPKENDETLNKKWYVYSDIWNRQNATEGEKTYTNHNKLEITLNKSLERPFVLELNEETQQLHLAINDVDNDDIISMRESNDNGETWHNVNFDTFHNNKWRYTDIKKEGRKYVGAELYTNIPIFNSALKRDLYFNNVIDETTSLNPTKSAFDTIVDKIVDIGNGIKIKNDLNIQEIDTEMSEIITSDISFFNELSGLFNDDSIVTQMKQGLQMHSNPFDVFIDFFVLPFDVEEVTRTSTSSNILDFGTYNHTFTNSFKKIRNAKEILMFETRINRIYNDWRDYQCNIYLYLPYVNIIPLDVNDFIDRLLSVTFVFDVASSTIKYFIKASNITQFTVEGSVRVSLPLSASNNVLGYQQKIGGASQIVEGLRNTYEGGGQLADAVDKIQEGKQSSRTKAIQEGIGGAFTIGEGLAKMTSGVRDILRPTPKVYSGNYSSSCAFYDELSAYLIIEQSNMMYDSNIINTYNLPDNRVSTLSNCNGYCEIDNIDLNVNCSEDIRQEIISILSSGFYI